MFFKKLMSIFKKSEETSPVVLKSHIYKEPDYQAKLTAAKSLSTPIDELKTLAKDELSSIRAEVAKNDMTPLNVLKELAIDEDVYVRYNVARNNNSSAELLGHLSKDEHNEIRHMVSKNKNTPIDVLKCLANDPIEYISTEAKNSLGRTNE